MGKLNFIKTANFCAAKDTINKVKTQNGKIFIIYLADETLELI